jgi:hypothetical protein
MAHCGRQLHVWVSDTDHAYLTAKADERGTTIGALIRALIRHVSRGNTSAGDPHSIGPTDRSRTPSRQSSKN